MVVMETELLFTSHLKKASFIQAYLLFFLFVVMQFEFIAFSCTID